MVEKGHSRIAFDRYGAGASSIYLALSVLFFGRSLIGHFSERYLGNGADPGQFMWYMRWWPYAIGHHLNPFWPRVVWPPTGVDIAWTASMPLPSLLAYPLTKAFGLIPTFNLLCLLCPALAGWAAFLLCRFITQAYWPSLLGGFIFGFSAHMLGKTFGDLNDALVFQIPLALYVSLLWLNQRTRTRTLVISLTLLLAVTFLCFIETFATMTLFGGVALLLALGLAGQDTKKQLLAMTGPLALSYFCTAILVGLYIYFLFVHRIRSPEIMSASLFSIDPLNFLIPTPLNELGKWVVLRRLTSQFDAQLLENGGYIALPVIAMAVLFIHRFWHTFRGRLMADFLIVTLIFSLGPHLHILETKTPIGLPWLPFTKLPFIQKALPARFMLYAFLDLAMMSAIWLTELNARAPAKFAIGGAAVLFMLPNLSSSYWTVEANVPAFFATGMYKQYISPGENVVILPYSINSDSMLWQARANMYFNMVQGWTGFPLTPTEFENWPFVQALDDNIGLPDAGRQLKAFLANYNVQVIIVASNCSCTWEYHPNDLSSGAWTRARVSTRDLDLWESWLSALGVKPVAAGGVLVYKVDPQQLTAYKRFDAMELKLADADYRFCAVLTAAARYVQAGYDLSKLSPVRAMELRLLPAELISHDFPSKHRELAPIHSQLLLTKMDDGSIAAGVAGPYSVLEKLEKKYGANANEVEYLSMEPPYGLVEKPSGGAQLLLIMRFDRANLLAEASRIGVISSPASAIQPEQQAASNHGTSSRY